MAFGMKFCPRCGQLVKRGEHVCPNCGTQLFDEKISAKAATDLTKERNELVEERVVVSENMSVAKREQLEREARIRAAQEQGASKSKAKKLERDKKKNKKQKVYKHKKVEMFGQTTDADGKIGIDVSDVTYLENKNPPKQKSGKKYDIPEKLKWWEIAKWADRMLAKRKVMKYVNRAATQIPERVSKVKMLLLCIFFGYMGAHNFYARNWTRAGITLGSFLISVIVVSVDVLRTAVGVSLGGGFGLVFVLCWIFDLVRIIVNKYRYSESKKAYIDSLNFDTRKILGRKYIKKEIELNNEYEGKNA